MQYGKLVNGVFEPLMKRYLHLDGRIYANPSEKTLLSLGYKPLIETEPPEEQDGCYVAAVYTETDKEILQSWEYQRLTEPEIAAI